MASLPLVGMPADTYENNGLYFHSLGDKYVRAVADVSKCLPVMIPSLGEALDIDSAARSFRRHPDYRRRLERASAALWRRAKRRTRTL